MKLHLILILISILTFSALGQTQKRIDESAEGSKAVLEFLNKENRIVWKKDDTARCDLIYVEGQPFRIIKANGLNIAFTPQVFGDYYVMVVYVRNESDKRITVKPEESSLGTWQKKEDSALMLPTIISPTDSEKIARKMESSQGWANVFSAIGASLATQNSTITNDRTGQSATITEPNTQAQTNAQNKARENSARTTSLANRVVNDAFKANTLFPGDVTSGHIYFKAKKHERGIFSINVEGIDYSFVYSFEKK